MNLRTKARVVATPFSLLLFLHFYGWQLFNSTPQAGPLFADLTATIQQSKCVWDGWLGRIKLEDAISNCSYVYSLPPVPIIQIIPASATLVEILGYLMALSLIYLYLQNLIFDKRVERLKAMALLLLFVSPPTLLLCQRGNLDALILILVLSAMMKKKTNRGFFFLVVASLIKYYVLPAVWIYALLLGVNRKKIIVLTFITLIAAAQLLLVQGSLPYPTDSAFGNSLPGKYLRQSLNVTFDPAINLAFDGLLGLTISILLFSMFKMRFRFFKLPPQDETIKKRQTIQLMTKEPELILVLLIFCTCYFLFSNYDYRLVWLCVFAKLLLEARILNSRHEWTFLILSFISVWFSYAFTSFQLLGDVCLLLLTVYIFTIFDIRTFLDGLRSRIN